MTTLATNRPHSDSLSLGVDIWFGLGIPGGRPANNSNTVRFSRRWRVLRVSALPHRAGIEIGSDGSVGCAPATRVSAPASRVPISDAPVVVPGQEITGVFAAYADIERTTRVAITVPR
jgi:hypothetical protein